MALHNIERRGVQIDLSYEHKQACPRVKETNPLSHGNAVDFSHMLGKWYGSSEIIDVYQAKKNGSSPHSLWFLSIRCGCGVEFTQQKNNFENGKKVCGKCSKVPNLTGKTFGKLFVIGFDKIEKGNSFWSCVCACGNALSVRARSLPKIKSCGCDGRILLAASATTHGLSKTREYAVWKSAIARVTNPNNERWKDYGGRGIKMCDRWNPQAGGGFKNFMDDMGECPAGLTLDRIDVNGDYCKENCRWATRFIQQVNRRGTTNTSGRIGVSLCPHTGRWRARLRFEGVVYWLGRFTSFDEACEAVTKKEEELHGCVRG